MSNQTEILIAGFGGQGVLFAGKILSYSALIGSKEVSWLPSYGPEMRGGAANCSVIISDSPIGSPVVTCPNIFVPMSLLSFDRFINKPAKGAIVVVDSTLIDKQCERKDLNVFYIPASQIAQQNGLEGLTNIILIAKVVKETLLFTYKQLMQGIKKCVPSQKEHLLDLNMRALDIGWKL